MGGYHYSRDLHESRVATCRSTGTDYFKHDADVREGRAEKKVHEKLDPSRKNAAGKNIRESFDSDVHPNSRPVAVLFDDTGSMGGVPRAFKDKLGALMSVLVKKAYLEHPHVLFGAIGDATIDKAPLQVGQFEGGNEMDEVLSLMLLEGGGGDSITESYELAMYFMSRHTDLDCFNKRGQKGYLFILGDEIPYSKVKKSEVKRIIGDDLQEDIPTEKILEELRDKFEVFWVIPGETNHWNDPKVRDPLQKMFGQNLLKLEQPEDVCELIAATIGVAEGYDIHEVASGLKDIGADAAAVGRASTALTKYATAAVSRRGATATGTLAEGGADAVSRL